MNQYLDPTDENLSPEEHDIEKALRPLTFDDFSGQDQVLENLQTIAHMKGSMSLVVLKVR